MSSVEPGKARFHYPAGIEPLHAGEVATAAGAAPAWLAVQPLVELHRGRAGARTGRCAPDRSARTRKRRARSAPPPGGRDRNRNPGNSAARRRRVASSRKSVGGASRTRQPSPAAETISSAARRSSSPAQATTTGRPRSRPRRRTVSAKRRGGQSFVRQIVPGDTTAYPPAPRPRRSRNARGPGSSYSGRRHSAAGCSSATRPEALSRARLRSTTWLTAQVDGEAPVEEQSVQLAAAHPRTAAEADPVPGAAPPGDQAALGQALDVERRVVPATPEFAAKAPERVETRPQPPGASRIEMEAVDAGVAAQQGRGRFLNRPSR